MQYRQLGKSGLRISEIGLGSWLTYGGYVEQGTAEQCIDRAYELGVNFFDTANVYHQGAAEEVVGKTLRKYPRDSYVLATKVFFPMGEGPNDRGLSRKHIMEQCHASLKRLGVDYIDLYQCHRYDPTVPLDETLRALDDLVRQGKVLYVGVSQWTGAQILDAVRLAEKRNLDQIVSNQPYYNMLGREIENEVIPISEREGIGQVVYSPLAQGVLTGKYKPGHKIPKDSRAADPGSSQFIGRVLTEENLRKVEKLSSLAADLGLSMPQFALAWVLRLSGISSAIVGASRPSQVEDNVKASGVEIPADVLEQVDKILKGEA